MSNYHKRLRIEIDAGSEFTGTEYRDQYIPVMRGIMIVREVDLILGTGSKTWEMRKINDVGDILILRQSVDAVGTVGPNDDTRVILYGENDANIYLYPNERIEIVTFFTSGLGSPEPMRADIFIEEPRY